MEKLRVLIADDHELFRRSLRALIDSRSDWEVCGEAEDGREAVEKARELKPDVILLDVTMPEMNGLEAARVISGETPGAKILIVSQNDPALMLRQAKDAGACAYIYKANVARDLMPTIDALFATRAVAAMPRAYQFVMDGTSKSEMAGLIQNKDWSKTPVGPPETWSPALRTMIDLLLANRFPLLLWWGPQFVQFYNDAYKPIPGAKHPASLGQRASECWREIWHIIGPLVDTPFNGGPSTWSEDLELELHRSSFKEETHFTVAYSPVPDATAPRGIGGVLATVHEITSKVVGERRLSLLRELASRATEARTVEEACQLAAQTFARYPKDVPFAVFYLLDAGRSRAHLTAAACIDPEQIEREVVIASKDGTHAAWRFANVLRENSTAVITNIQEHLREVPRGPWSDPPDRAVVVPIPASRANDSRGLLVLGVSPRLALDHDYRAFFQLVASQLGTAIANAEAYDEERRRAEALAEIDRAKTLFFSNVSHEFRTPLTLMLGPLEDTLAASAALSTKQRESLEVAHRNSLRLLKLVNTLLDFSRIEAGRLEARFEPTDLASFTTHLASSFRSAIERAGMKLVVDCPQLPQLVYVDREMWEKIVLNLLSNAFKFTFEGEIVVKARAAGSNVEIVVSDTGTGIPAEEIPRLFARFHRVKGARGRSYEGSGIGLALVQELVKLHGGAVHAESEIDRGSRFIVTLPFGKAHLPADRIVESPAQISPVLRGEAFVEEALRWLPAEPVVASQYPSSRQGHLKSAQPRPLVLLADDNADMRDYVRRLLNSKYEVITVADGEAALRTARERRPDLILSDVMMPFLDGFGLLKAVRADDGLKDVPVILLSARAGDESRIEGLDVGADDYLVKPFSARELQARVRSHLAMAQTRSETAELQRELLAESEFQREQLRELFEQVPAAICLLSGPEHRYTFVNPEYVKLTGRLHAQDFLGKTVREALPEFESQPFLDLLDRVYRTGTAHVGSGSKVVMNGTDGPRESYHNFIYQPMRSHFRQIDGILVHVVDVTEQVLARKKVEESERQLREIIDNLPAAIYTTDAQGRITHFNAAAVEFSGRTPEIGSDEWCVTWKMFHPDGTPLPHDQCPMATALKEGRAVRGVEAIAERPDGTRRWFMPFPTPLLDSDGKIIGGINMLVDITTRKEAERVTSLLAAIVDSSDDVIVSKNLDGVITSWNKAAERVFGYSAEEAVGRHITLIIPRERWSEEDMILSKLRRGEKIDHFETVRLRKDGTTVDVALTISPVRDASGRVIGASKVARDITERKRAEIALGDAALKQTALFHLADELHRADSLDEVYAAALKAICNAMRCERASILLYDEQGTMRFVRWLNLSDAYRNAVEGHSPWKRDDSRAEPVCVEDVRTAELDDHLKKIIQAEGIQALAFVPLISNHRLIGKFMMYFPEPHVFTTNELNLCVTIARQLAFGIERKRADEALRTSEEQFRTLSATLDAEVRSRTRELENRNNDMLRQSTLLRDLSRRLLHAQDEERRRIARELHDSVGQTLAVLGMSLARISQHAPDSTAGLGSTIQEAEGLVQQLHQEIRTMSYLLHPPLLDETGLVPALTWYVEGLQSRSGLKISLMVPDSLERLPREMELVIFRLVQESLTNIHRHSESKVAAIAITRESDSISIEVRDQGKGMSPQRLAEIQSRGSGVGIRGMRERVQQLHGDMQIESGPSGTRVLVTIPVPKPSVAKGKDYRSPLPAAV